MIIIIICTDFSRFSILWLLFLFYYNYYFPPQSKSQMRLKQPQFFSIQLTNPTFPCYTIWTVIYSAFKDHKWSRLNKWSVKSRAYIGLIFVAPHYHQDPVVSASKSPNPLNMRNKTSISLQRSPWIFLTMSKLKQPSIQLGPNTDRTGIGWP